MMRRSLIAVLILVGLGAVLWQNRLDVLLQLNAWRVERADPIGPHRVVNWQQGPARPLENQDAAQRPPNIILILADDLGFNDVSAYGGGFIPTPNIDALAREGASFANGYSGNAVCAPSRAMLMTGRYSTRFGFEFTPTPPGFMRLVGMVPRPDRLHPNIAHAPPEEGVPDFRELGMPPEEITLAETLRDVGYHTVHIGKWHLGGIHAMLPNQQGFDESLLMASGKYLPEDHPDSVNAKQDFDPIDRFLWPSMRYAASFNGSPNFAPDGYLTDYYTKEAVKVIHANRNRPFFLYLAHWAVHTPLQAARKDYDALEGKVSGPHRAQTYAAMIKALDRSVGEVMAALKKEGLDKNTLVIFTSDNGGAHYIGLPKINQPYRGWKLTLFEGGVHVPFFMRWPEKIAAGTKLSAPVSHLDVFTTAANAAKAVLPQDRIIDGVDLVPPLTGGSQDALIRPLFWRQSHYQSVLVGGWKLQRSGRLDKIWLFDLNTDPYEKTNLAETRTDKKAELLELLDAHDAAQAEPLWPSIGEFPISIDKDLSKPDAPEDEFIYWAN